MSKSEEQEVSKNNWYAAILVTAFIFLVLGYAWRYGQEQVSYDQGFEDGMEEMSVGVKGEICQ